MRKSIPVVVDQTTELDVDKRHWKLSLYNPDGSVFTGETDGGLTIDQIDEALGAKLEAEFAALGG